MSSRRTEPGTGVIILTASLSRDTLGRRLFGEESQDLKFEGKREDIRHGFKQVRTARIA